MERVDDMTEETKQKIQKIAQTYGYDAQSRQCIEEMAELTQAINKFWRKQLKCGLFTVEEIRNCGEGVSSLSELKDTDGYKNLVEEMADVQIMLWQLEYLLNADTSIIIQQKLDRQMEGMKSE